MREALRKARPSEYEAWLRRYLAAKGKISRINTAKFVDQENWFTAYKDFTVEPLHGAASINIIVPSYVTALFLDGEIGHNKLYLMSNLYSKTSRSVELFSDIDVFF